ncbi:hypothetical protein AB7849_15330 [Rhodanobacter sp. 115]|uniref:hypothetical protein n=1 Tax=Rhodanobacter sp. FW021-MT20 TaxID=1162282 RepID=UPI0034E49B33
MNHITNRLKALKARCNVEARNYLTRRLAPAVALATISIDNAYAQSFGTGMGGAICAFKNSPMPTIIAAVAIIAIAVMLILNEGKGLGSWVVKVIIGVGIIASIGSIVTILVPNGTLGC